MKGNCNDDRWKMVEISIRKIGAHRVMSMGFNDNNEDTAFPRCTAVLK